MYIDVIVPNFDDSAEDVIISAWYKKIGDKISKGEVIADVESESVTCGITSGYDCILYRVVAREGQTVQQGMKIAVIDTEAGLENPDVMAYEERKIAQEILEHIPNANYGLDNEQASEISGFLRLSWYEINDPRICKINP